MPKYSRFEGGTSFIGYGHDFSGAGRTTLRLQKTDANGNLLWRDNGAPLWSKAILDFGTLISPSFQMAAHHAGDTPNLVVENSYGRHPEAHRNNVFPSSEVVRFYYANVGPNHDLENANNYEQYEVTENWWAGNRGSNSLKGDVEIGKLASPVSASVAVYPILLFENQNNYVGTEVFCFGKPGSAETQQRHQRACIRLITAGWTNGLSYTYHTNAATAPPLSGYPTLGDSGSPSLTADFGWGLVLAGTHWSRTSDNAVTTAAMRDALRQEMWDAQPGVAEHKREVPTFWTGVMGDYNGSFAREAGDLDILTREANYLLSASRGYNWYLDLNEDGQVNAADVDELLLLFATVRGDANLDGKVNSADMNIVGLNWLKTNKGWADGDFNGDGTVDSTDMNLLAFNWLWGV